MHHESLIGRHWLHFDVVFKKAGTLRQNSGTNTHALNLCFMVSAYINEKSRRFFSVFFLHKATHKCIERSQVFALLP